ncbi:MAG TPA: HAD-IC family P-type ATPase, partial [Thermoanaerobaculia bacterium]|nr:HAD-IC family P-type ATPase [Thermoanaerobaculia bacterium]
GSVQERKAEASAAALQELLVLQARVRRDGRDLALSAEELVPGDLVLLESGNRVPADLRLLAATGLAMDESFLTGESEAAEKGIAPLPAETPVADRRNLAFAGATTTAGRGLGLVVATGAGTEVGQIARAVVEGEGSKPPLLIRMDRFAHQISLVVLAATGLLAVVALGKGMPWLEVFFFAVALAVSAIPEGLPVALTVALSVATSRMAKRHVIVRKLAAVESLGSCQVIASDKTGTLTVNQQTVTGLHLPSGEAFRVRGEGYAGAGSVEPEAGSAIGGAIAAGTLRRLARLARAAVICNEAELAEEGGAWRHSGDAMDVALLALAHKLGQPPREVRAGVRLLGAIPFESERRYAAQAYEESGRAAVAAKGALEALLPLCARMDGPEGPLPLAGDEMERVALALAEGGHRVLALADGELAGTAAGEALDEAGLPPLTLLGLAAFIDPLRPGAKEAVAACRGAGIDVLMITGDHPATARTIAAELGIGGGEGDTITGAELAAAGAPGSAAHLAAVGGHHVFARVSPLQKVEIVGALVDSGQYVAVTGDGVNDAPALKRANLGVAMGSGTDVAKDTAAMIVTDDNFASIVAGVEEGRFAYDNVRKVVYLLIATGAAEVLLFTLALLTGLPLPLFAVQILWLNLVTNGIQDVALAFEGGEPGAMKRPPRRPEEGIFDRLMVQQTVTSGLVMGGLAFGLWVALLAAGTDESSARNQVLLLMVLLQNVHVFNCRSERVSAFRVPLARNRILVAGVLGAQGLHVLAMHLPFLQDLLRTSAVPLRQWLLLLALALPVLLAMELFKLFRAWRASGAVA